MRRFWAALALGSFMLVVFFGNSACGGGKDNQNSNERYLYQQYLLNLQKQKGSYTY